MAEELIIEADGGSRGNPGVAGYGALLRDSHGVIVGEEAGYVGHATNNVAEYRGLIGGLSMAKALGGFRRLKIRMDSRLVIEQISGHWKIKHEAMKLLAAQARELVVEFEKAGVRVEYQWVPRTSNKEADRLSNVAMDAGDAGRAPGWKIQSRKVPDYEAIGGAEGRRNQGGALPTASLAYFGVEVSDFSQACSDFDWLLTECGFRFDEKSSDECAWRSADGMAFCIRDGRQRENSGVFWQIGVNVEPGTVRDVAERLPAHGWSVLGRHALSGYNGVLTVEYCGEGRIELIPMVRS